MGTRFALIGDIHGRFNQLAEALDVARRRWGPLEFLLAVGDVEPNPRYRKVGDFPQVVAGDINLGAPLYFIGGNHDPYPALDQAGAGEWAPGVWWLGRWGISRVVDFNVAYLSGIHSKKYSDTPEMKRSDPKQRTYWHRSESEQLIRTARRYHGRIDVLLTHDWPSGIGTNREGKPVGDPSVRQLTEALRPRIHASGHMHHDHQARIGSTQIVCLAKPRHTPTSLQGIAVVERQRRGNLRILP